MSEKRKTQKTPIFHHLQPYNLNETPYYTTLQPFNTAQTQHQQAQTHANPQSCVMFFCKSGADADCVGAARHFRKKKKFQRIFTAHRANADFTKQKGKRERTQPLLFFNKKPRKALHNRHFRKIGRILYNKLFKDCQVRF